MKIIMMTGISGSDVNGFAEACVTHGNKSGGSIWKHLRFADILYEVDSERGRLSYDDWEDSILKRGTALPHLRNAAFDRLLEIIEDLQEAEKKSSENILIVSTHATFWWRKTLQAGLDLTRLNELNPELFVTIIDDVLNTWNRLRETKQPRWDEMSPVDILEWREIEIFMTEQFSQISGSKDKPKPFFLFSRNQSPLSLIRIVNEPNVRRYYRSYPMTFVSGRPEVQKDSDQIGEELSEIAVVFDPKDLEDWDRKEQLKESYQAWCEERGYTFSGAEWQDIIRHLLHQTVSRDHRLIDQSHGVVVYYPELEYWTEADSRYRLTPLVPFSSGVLDEMQYATQQGKVVYLIWTSDRDPGPFLPSIYSEKFKSGKDLVKYLRTKKNK